MRWTVSLPLLPCVYLLLAIAVGPVGALEPVTTGIAMTVAAATSAFFAGFDNFIKCQIFECCTEPWIRNDIGDLRKELSSKLYGQHVVIDAVVKSIYGHIKFPNPEKALVLSFHGTTGIGKNYVSKIIAENLYRNGMNSQNVHLIHSPSVFPHESSLPLYQDQLRQWIRGNVSACNRQLFIFDEIDKMPPGLINSLKPFLDHYPEIEGVDYRKSIFLLLSNTGGKQITDFMIHHWSKGRSREEIKYSELEQILTKTAFNDKGGLWHSSLIDYNLVSAFIPFLPLERRHVKQCITDDLLSKRLPLSDEQVERIADEMHYGPPDLKLISITGCKRVSEKVNFYLLYEEL